MSAFRFAMIAHGVMQAVGTSRPVIVASARGASEALAFPLDGRLNVSKPGGFQPVELVRCVETLIGSFIPEVEPGP